MLWPRRMRDLWAWDPWREMRRLQSEMGRVLNDLWPAGFRRVFPAVNLWTGREDVVVTAELPGVAPDAIEVSVVGDTLTLSGTRDAQEPTEGETWIRQERPAGQFTRTIQLPYRVDPDAVEATTAKGILRITLPRHQADKPKQIAVKPS